MYRFKTMNVSTASKLFDHTPEQMTEGLEELQVYARDSNYSGCLSSGIGNTLFHYQF
jgi:hypothetical protein